MIQIINKIKKNLAKLAIVPLMAGMTACQLDYENTSAIDPSGAWGSETMIEAYLTHIYGGMMPGWNFWGGGSDECIYPDENLSDFFKGINNTVGSRGVNFDYNYIDRINFMLKQLKDVPESVLSKQKNGEVKAQALFWRAWNYWSYVKSVGGVPLILEPQDVTNLESLYVKRSSTSECMTQILADLDEAISLLPDRWTGNDYGKIDKCTAMAFKGRVLLWYASPLFNRDNSKDRWEAAYKANKDAYDACLAAGYKLMPDFSQIWLTDGSANTEALMFRRYKYPDSSYGMQTLLPETLTNGYFCCGMPMLTTLIAFPDKDGNSLTIFPKNDTYNNKSLDVDRLATDPEYNEEMLKTLIEDMDPRFYASMSIPGGEFPSDFIPAGQYLWTSLVHTPGGFKSMLDKQFNIANTTSVIYGNFFPLKAVTPGTDKSTSTYLGQNQWIEIRLAEVYMNLAECANGCGKYTEALEYIAALRERAGINRGEGAIGYGLDRYASTEGVKHLLITERLAEFAQENKRGDDLRRWMRYDIYNDQEYVSNILVVLNDVNDSKYDFDFTRSIRDEETRKMFHLEYIKNIKTLDISKYDVPTNLWFSPIGETTMAKNYSDDKAMQNNEWGGTFDPLK